jgi:type IV secretion system protein VirB1
MAMIDCPDLAVPKEVMQHVVRVESSRNPFAIGVVGGYLARQPTNLEEALATVRQLKEEGYNFSVGISQVNRYNLAKYGLTTYAEAFDVCANLKAGSRILRECYDRAQDWGKAFSCYYSGNFSTGFEHGYVQKIFASIRKAQLSLTEKASAVRIIPYKNTPRRTARDDNTPLIAATSSDPVLPAEEDTYPEPYAVRKFMPSTSLSITAAALRHATPRGGSSIRGVETAERHPAIPVPGSGALMPNSSAPLASALSHIPTQLVGLNGDPYKTRIVSPSGALGLSANQLPLPNPSALTIPVSSSDRRAIEFSADKAMNSRKGGSLLHSSESSGDKPENTAKGEQPDAVSSQRYDSSGKTDDSFVF